jgi:hypothetical protein
MLKTNWHEVKGAALGSAIGMAIPLLCHIQMLPTGNDNPGLAPELMGTPLIEWSLPGFLAGAIVGICIARRRA